MNNICFSLTCICIKKKCQNIFKERKIYVKTNKKKQKNGDKLVI